MKTFFSYNQSSWKALLAFSLLLSNLSSSATNYFFSTDGMATASGLSARQAISDIRRLSALLLKRGDTVFFRRGDVFRGSFVLTASGSVGAPIVFTTYGSGALPVISGGIPLQQWQRGENGVWSHTVTKPVLDLFADGIRQTIARYPNSGFLRIDSGVNKNRLFSKELVEEAPSFAGATIRLRTIDWAYEMRKVTGSEKGWLNLGFHPLYTDGRGMQIRSSNSTTTIYNLSKGYGFYLDGLRQFLDSTGEWVQQGNQLFFKPGNLTLQSKIEGTTEETGITLNAGVSNILFQNLHLTQFFHHGIAGGEGLRNITIENCTLTNINTAAVSIDSGSVNTIIRGCIVQDINGKGIALLEAEKAVVENCIVNRIGLIPGYGFTGVNGGTAISINNIESKVYKKDKYANHCLVRWNTVDSCGYNGIRVDGSDNLVEQNIIRYCGLTLNDGSALYCFAAQPGVTHHSIFRNNVVLHSQGNITGTPANAIHFNGIYIDNNSHDMLIEGNTSAHHSSAGMVNNDASFRNSFRNNVVYDCAVGMGFAEWANLGKISNCMVEGNTIVSLRPEQHWVELLNFIGSQTRFASFRNNSYIHTTRTNGFRRETKQLPQNSRFLLCFADWQQLMQADSGSTSLSINDSLLQQYKPELITNGERTPLSWTPWPGRYLSSTGKPLSETLVLPPNSSLVVLKKVD